MKQANSKCVLFHWSFGRVLDLHMIRLDTIILGKVTQKNCLPQKGNLWCNNFWSKDTSLTKVLLITGRAMEDSKRVIKISFQLIALKGKVVLIRLGIYSLINKARKGGSPKFFIHTLWCYNYMRLKFHSYEFNIWGSLKQYLFPFLKTKIFLFSNLRTNMLKITPIKFQSK
jgi:hypothetical protein